MPWKLPSEEIRARVNAAFGTDHYRRMQTVWEAALSQLPGPVPKYTQEQQLREKLPAELRGAEGPIDPTSAHYLGLARDVGWRGWPLAYKRQVASILEQSGFAVERTKSGKLFRAHLHYGVPKAAIRANGLMPLIQQVVAGISAARGLGQIAER